MYSDERDGSFEHSKNNYNFKLNHLVCLSSLLTDHGLHCIVLTLYMLGNLSSADFLNAFFPKNPFTNTIRVQVKSSQVKLGS